ncbi:MAG: hypothetical protein WC770_02935 [Phycisphaerae bacterium]|jgi:hypothetical protein
MKDVISKMTFSFLMAQFLPGAVVMFSAICAFGRVANQPNNSCGTKIAYIPIEAAKSSLASPFHIIGFVFLSVAIGMLIHGIHWVTLGGLEHYATKKNKEHSIRDLWWYKNIPAFPLIAFAPIIMAMEVICFLLVRRIDSLTMDENVSDIPKDKIDAFLYLQEFYLSFGQFYAHMAYALAISLFFILKALKLCNLSCVQHYSFAVGLWLLVGIFFVLGRIQLSSLFKAEREIVKKTDPKPKE